MPNLTLYIYKNQDRSFDFVHSNNDGVTTYLRITVTTDDSNKLVKYHVQSAYYQTDNDFYLDRHNDKKTDGERHMIDLQKAHNFFKSYWLSQYQGKTFDELNKKIEY